MLASCGVSSLLKQPVYSFKLIRSLVFQVAVETSGFLSGKALEGDAEQKASGRNSLDVESRQHRCVYPKQLGALPVSFGL